MDGNRSQSSPTRHSAGGSQPGYVPVEMRRSTPAAPILSSLSMATMAGVSRRTFFNYFPAKEAALSGTDPDMVARAREFMLARPATEDTVTAVRGATLERLRELVVDAELWQMRRAVSQRHPEFAAGLVLASVWRRGLPMSRTAALCLAGLGFLGFGIEPSAAAEWGFDLNKALPDASNGIWWTSVFPGTAIVLIVLGVTLVGESLNDLADPRLRTRRRAEVAAHTPDPLEVQS